MHWGQKVTSGLWQERSQFVLHFPGEKLVIRRLNYIIFLYWIIIVNECNMLQFIDCYKTLTNGDKIHLYNKEPEHGFRSVHVLQTYLFHLHWLGLLLRLSLLLKTLKVLRITSQAFCRIFLNGFCLMFFSYYGFFRRKTMDVKAILITSYQGST